MGLGANRTKEALLKTFAESQRRTIPNFIDTKDWKKTIKFDKTDNL